MLQLIIIVNVWVVCLSRSNVETSVYDTIYLYICNELGDLGVGWSPNRPTTTIRFPKNTDTIQRCYNDLMIGYNKSSQLLQKPVTTGGASVYWTLGLGHRSTDVGWPGWSAPTALWSRFGLQFLDLLYGFWPDIYITSLNIIIDIV